jgi:23S rRNA pseudouridine1911/1915/1917 synthase
VHETAETLLNSYVGAPPGQTRVFHVHRLDRDTSGVLVFAKGEFMRDRLQALFAEHDIERAYVAIVHGKPRPHLRVRTVADAKLGKEAVTRYRTVASGRHASILELALETGRRHQIRVQLAAAGHPVVGDRIYGRDEDPLGRLALHARRLAFVRPDTGRRVELTAEPPASFRNFAL